MNKCSPHANVLLGSFAAPLLVVLGPTASGKSELAIRIAQEFDGEIVNFDSIQVYRNFNIGSAKLPVNEHGGIPHHLIDFVDPDQLFTAGDYARAARGVLQEIVSRNRVPVLVGGTGFYLRALLEGLSPAPQRDESIRLRLTQREEKRKGSLHRLLSRLNPAASARIHPNDQRKLIRALELCLVARANAVSPQIESGNVRRQPGSALPGEAKEALSGFQTIKLGLDPPRAELYGRINSRVGEMFASGLIDEIQSILSSGVAISAKPFESLGYSQAVAYLEGRLSLEEAVTLAQQATRQYAKRQMTWFRRERDVEWFQNFGTAAEAQSKVIDAASRKMKGPPPKDAQPVAR